MAFVNGVDLVTSKLTMTGDQIGSTVFTNFVNYILVSKTGAVLKVTSIDDDTTANYSVLLGDDSDIQVGFEYPQVARALKPDANVDSEYYYYDNGGTYPWRSMYPNLLLMSTSHMGDYG